MKLALLILAASLSWAAPPVKILSLTCPKVFAPGESGVCVITIAKPAPKGGAAFRITFVGSGLIAPEIVTVPKGATTVAFPIVRPLIPPNQA